MLLVGVVVFVATQVERPAALVQVWIPWAQVATLALLMTPVVVAGGIDLSVGAMAALSMVVLGVVWRDLHGSPLVAIGCALGTGGICGLVNGGLVSIGLSPLITTIATMGVFSGLALLLTGGERISGFPETLLAWERPLGVPCEYWLLALVAFVSAALLHATRYGRYCYAAGENRLAARYAAVPLRPLDLGLYCGTGLGAALVAVTYVVHRDAAVPDAFRGVELRAIACIVVGGTSIAGGHGSIGRTLLGVTIVSLLDVGLEFLGNRVRFFSAEARLVVLGGLLILAGVWSSRAGNHKSDHSVSGRKRGIPPSP